MSFLEDSKIVAEALADFQSVSQTGAAPVMNVQPMQAIIDDLDLDAFARKGGLRDEKLSVFMHKYLSYATRIHHPGYMGHQCAAPHYSGALAALIDSFINNPMAIYEMGPAAASIEYFLVNWMLGKVGWPAPPVERKSKTEEWSFGGGVLVNGGSLANLLVLLIARRKVAPDAWQSGSPGDLALLAPEISHYSVEKAAGIMGIGRNAIYALDVDENGAVLPHRLQAALTRMIDDGKRPLALVANACSTAVGIYDPLQEIAEFCQHNDIWFHVDGAHGASALLSDTHKARLNGIELADSVIWDAHKMLQTPSLCAAVLVRHEQDLDAAMQHDASYLFYQQEQPGFDFLQRTVECTKSALGSKFFFVLAALGEQGLAKFVDDRYDLAQQAYVYIQQQSDFNCPVQPQSNILCFRIDADDAVQLRIRDALMERGQSYLTSTMFNGRRYLRLAFMSPNTTIASVHQLIDEIRKIDALSGRT